MLPPNQPSIDDPSAPIHDNNNHCNRNEYVIHANKPVAGMHSTPPLITLPGVALVTDCVYARAAIDTPRKSQRVSEY